MCVFQCLLLSNAIVIALITTKSRPIIFGFGISILMAAKLPGKHSTKAHGVTKQN